jgi:hypothetical protein
LLKLDSLLFDLLSFFKLRPFLGAIPTVRFNPDISGLELQAFFYCHKRSFLWSLFSVKKKLAFSSAKLSSAIWAREVGYSRWSGGVNFIACGSTII